MITFGRSWEVGSEYRYGFNGHEQDDEVYGNGNMNTALFWGYDNRLGRRWNIVPVTIAAISPYSVFVNNPIVYNDANGDCPTCISGAISGALVEIVMQVGAQMANGVDFEAAIAKVDWEKVIYSASSGFFTGVLTGGSDKLIKLAADPKYQKALGFVLKEGIDLTISALDYTAEKLLNDESFEVDASYIYGILAEYGLGKVVPDSKAIDLNNAEVTIKKADKKIANGNDPKGKYEESKKEATGTIIAGESINSTITGITDEVLGGAWDAAMKALEKDGVIPKTDNTIDASTTPGMGINGVDQTSGNYVKPVLKLD